MKVYTDAQLLYRTRKGDCIKSSPFSVHISSLLSSPLVLSFPCVSICINKVVLSSFCVADLLIITMADRFDCDNCKESLYGRKYIQSDDSPYCIPCYDSLFSNTCDECKELIGHDARVRHSFWHMQVHAEFLKRALICIQDICVVYQKNVSV